MKRSVVIITLCFLSALFLTGAKLLDVELRTKEPLLDLSDVIRRGSSIVPGDGEFHTDDRTAQREALEGTSASKREITIRVRDRSIYVNGLLCAPQNFESVFRQNYQSGMRVNLQDDYAEYHTFSEIIAKMEERKVKYLLK